MPERARIWRILEAATLAPSSHNTQPWIFDVAQIDVIRLFVDRRRALPVNDPAGREMTISCGAALMNLRAAAAAESRAPRVRLLPEPGRPDLLAEVTLARRAAIPEDLAALAPAVPLRRTCRSRFSAIGTAEAVLPELTAAAAAEGATLTPVSDEVRPALAALVAEGALAQWSNRSWRRELASWMRPRRQGEGLAVAAGAAPLARLAVRRLDMGARMAARDARLAADAPVLAVLGTAADEPRDWLCAGQALARVLLRAAQAGVQAGYLNQPVQVAALRPRLAALTGEAGAVHLVLRLGMPGNDLPRSLRRPLDDVVRNAPS